MSLQLWLMNVQECGKKKKMINEKKQLNSDEQISPLKFLIC